MIHLRNSEFKVAASLAALDRLNTGVLLLNHNGDVSFANRAADAILAEDDGLRLRHRADKSSSPSLMAADAGIGQALEAAIRSAIDPDILNTNHFGQYLAIPRMSGRASHILQFSSLPASNEFGHGEGTPRAIIFIADAAGPVRINAALLSEAYGLTPAEIRVAEAMAAGAGTTEDVARKLRLRTNTLKSHIKQIYAKTNVDSRARLLKLLLSLSGT